MEKKQLVQMRIQLKASYLQNLTHVLFKNSLQCCYYWLPVQNMNCLIVNHNEIDVEDIVRMLVFS